MARVCWARSISRGWCASPSPRTAHLDEEELARLVPRRPCASWTISSTSRAFRLPEQRAEALAKRRIGLGVTGLADALILCGARYGSAEGVALTERWLAAIERAAYLASAELAAEKGAFPLFDTRSLSRRRDIAALADDVRDAIAAHGIRNALLTSIAPTGTISLFADNVSSGVEPVFAFATRRNVLMPDGTRQRGGGERLRLSPLPPPQGRDAPLPDYFVDAQTLGAGRSVRDAGGGAEIRRQLDLQDDQRAGRYSPSSDFKDVYLQAYELGCKGCTTYRPNDGDGRGARGAKRDRRRSGAAAELPLPAPQRRRRRPTSTRPAASST